MGKDQRARPAGPVTRDQLASAYRELADNLERRGRAIFRDRDLAQDLVSETFAIAFQRFVVDGVPLKPPYSLEGAVHGVHTNLVLTRHRTQKRHPRESLDAVEYLADNLSIEQPDDSLPYFQRISNAIDAANLKLSDRVLVATFIHFIVDMPPGMTRFTDFARTRPEFAELKPCTIRKRLERALARLRDHAKLHPELFG